MRREVRALYASCSRRGGVAGRAGGGRGRGAASACMLQSTTDERCGKGRVNIFRIRHAEKKAITTKQGPVEAAEAPATEMHPSPAAPHAAPGAASAEQPAVPMRGSSAVPLQYRYSTAAVPALGRCTARSRGRTRARSRRWSPPPCCAPCGPGSGPAQQAGGFWGDFRGGLERRGIQCRIWTSILDLNLTGSGPGPGPAWG